MDQKKLKHFPVEAPYKVLYLSVKITQNSQWREEKSNIHIQEFSIGDDIKKQ